MGQVSSSISLGGPFCVDPHRLAVQRLVCLREEGSGLVEALDFRYDQLSEQVVVQRPGNAAVAFAKDAETSNSLTVLETSGNRRVHLRFTLSLGSSLTPPSSLLFAVSRSTSELNRCLEDKNSWIEVNTGQSDTQAVQQVNFTHSLDSKPGPVYFAFAIGEVLAGGGLFFAPPAFSNNYGIPASRPGSTPAFEPEDGPQFRSSVASMEKQFPFLKARVKQMLKRSINSHNALQQLIEADELFAESVSDGAQSELLGLRPLAPWFEHTSEGGMSAIQRQRKISLNEMAKRVIEPLQSLYDGDIKQYDSRKRQFDELSSEFYSWTSRYLSSRRDRAKSGEPLEAKFAAKKRGFDQARYDYFTYLLDLCSGLKQQILLQLFSLAAQSLTDSQIALGSELESKTRPQIDGVVEDVKLAAREWDLKPQIESSVQPAPPTSPNNPPTPHPNTLTPTSPAPLTSRPSHISKSPHVSKEGLLWSCRPDTNLPKWHKYWVILDGGALREYTNWKQSVDLHSEPILLARAQVREAQTDRRFCFEVTTQQTKRLFQATSEEDMRSWIHAISNAQGSSGSGTPHHFRPLKSNHRIESLTRRLSMKTDHKPRVAPIVTSQSVGNAMLSPPPVSKTSLFANDELLQQIYKESSNRVCAECGTTQGVEWVSINLLMVMCIECSGAHRSLGAHISKVRSLTLDVGAFTPSLRAALFSVSNASMNAIWEARLPNGRKLAADAASKTRVKFVTEKYVEKQFISELDKPNAILRRAITELNIPKMCAALASRANPNGMSDDNEPMVILALRSVAPGQDFAMAEVLIKNGATVPPEGEYQGLSSQAEAYLAQKREQP